MLVCSSRSVWRLWSVSICRLVLACSMLSVVPDDAAAQDNNSHWGVSASLTPGWKLADGLREQLFEENETATWKGKEFSIGLVRGRARGGDWGVSFVRKPFDDESNVTTVDEQCFTQTQCTPETEVNQFRGVYLNAFEVHWSPMFVTIKNRVQIGLNVGGGLGAMHGEIVRTRDGFNQTGFDPKTQKAILTPFHEVETLQAADELLKYFPLIKLEAVGGVILSNALKVKVAGGVNFPAYSGRVELVYLIGG